MWRKLCYRLLFCFVLIQASRLCGSPPTPQLGISPSAGQVNLFWQDTNNWLQSSATLLNSFFWVNVSTPPTLSGATNTVTLPADQPVAFFRLVNSPALPPPTELELQNLSDTNGICFFELTWDAVPGAVSYNLYMASVPGVDSLNYTNLPDGMVFAGITSSYTDVPDVPAGIFLPALTPGKQYYFVVTAVSPSAQESANSNPTSGIFGPSGSVEGSVFTQLVLGTNTTDVSLPNVSLSLVNTTNSSLNASFNSDVNGDFVSPALPAGTYQLCWQATGFMPGCSNQITIGNTDIELDPIQLYPNTAYGLVYGQITFQDGSPVYAQDGFFGINVNPTLTLRNASSNLVAVASPNSDGEYVMAGVPKAPNMSLSATLQNNGVVSNINTMVTGEADLVLPNSPPVIQSLVATVNGAPVYRVPPGTTVQVTATAYDPDGDALSYQWFGPYGPLSYSSSSNISWTLPANAVGFQYLFLLVSDGHGGYANERLELTVNPYVFFSGTVLGSDTGAPLTNAVVQLNNVITTTDTNGYFSIELAATNEYDLAIAQNGYVPLGNVYFDGMADQTYTLLAISSPFSSDCTGNLPNTMVTNFANGVAVSLPTQFLLESDNSPYAGCIRVTLDTLDPCNPTNNFAGGNLMTNGIAFEPYGLVNIGVWDTNGNPLHLSAGYLAEVFLPIASSCVDPFYPPLPSAQFFTLLNPPTNRWLPLASGNLVTNSFGPNTFTGYDGFVGALGLLAAAPPAPVAPPPTVNLQFKVDASLHIPVRIGLFKDNGNGVPDQLQPIGGYQDIDEDGQTLMKVPVPQDPNPKINNVIWVEVLNLRQAPGNYFGQASSRLPDNQKDVIQALKVTLPDAANPAVVTLGLGVAVDKPRSAPLKGLPTAALNGLKDRFLTRRSAEDGYNPFTDYYDKIDLPKAKRDFVSWQKENNWPSTGFSQVGGGANNARAVYFNANDLGAGRRMGMNIFTDIDGKPSVAYYVATFATLADAEEDEAANRQPGDPKSKLKYIVCMDYSLSLKTKFANATANDVRSNQRYIKFYAYTNNSSGPLGISGEVPNEARDHPLSVPYLCMNCHGGTGIQLHGAADELGDVKGQFVAFDLANYTFGNNAPTMPDPKVRDIFTALNNGLLTAQSTMPPNLVNLINAIKATGYTTDSSALPNWGNGYAGTAQQAADLYNKVYAVSCRSCHASFCSDRTANANRGRNWSTASEFQDDLGNRNVTPTGNRVMPHAQRTYGIFWGSATGKQLNDLNPKVINQPAVISQPATGNNQPNSNYF